MASRKRIVPLRLSFLLLIKQTSHQSRVIILLDRLVILRSEFCRHRRIDLDPVGFVLAEEEIQVTKNNVGFLKGELCQKEF